MARATASRAAAVAAPASTASTSSINPRKRRQSSPATVATAPASQSLGTLEFDDAGEDDGDVLAASDEGDSEAEAFPELDVDGSASEDASGSEGDDESFDGSYDSEEDAEDELDDEAQLRAELEMEQNEILSGSSDDEEEDTSDLDELIRRNTVKPLEDEPEISSIPGQNCALGERGDDDEAFRGLTKDYMKRSRTVKSRLTGQEKTIWDEEIEPDYASDSSTEEVWVTRKPICVRLRRVLTRTLHVSRRRTASATFRNIGTMTCLTSATTSTAKRSCVPRPATSSTAS